MRRRRRVGLSVRLKVLALNFKRYVAYLGDSLQVAAPTAAFAC